MCKGYLKEKYSDVVTELSLFLYRKRRGKLHGRMQKNRIFHGALDPLKDLCVITITCYLFKVIGTYYTDIHFALSKIASDPIAGPQTRSRIINHGTSQIL